MTGNARFTPPETTARGRLEAQVAVARPRPRPVAADRVRSSSGPEPRSRPHPRRARRAPGGRARRRPHRGPHPLGRAGARRREPSTSSISPAPTRGSAAASQPDGSGRIAGKVTAQRAAPLVDLLGTRVDRRRLEARAAFPARGRSRPRCRRRARGPEPRVDRRCACGPSRAAPPPAGCSRPTS